MYVNEEVRVDMTVMALFASWFAFNALPELEREITIDSHDLMARSHWLALSAKSL